VEYRAAFLSLNVAVSFIGTYGAVAACEQFRIAICSGNTWDARYKQLLLVAVCLGGVCIWGEFYMMMSAYRLDDSSGAVVFIQYDSALCVGSIPVVIVLTYIGLLIASTDPGIRISPAQRKKSRKYTDQTRGTLAVVLF
jgi:NO-binding membrane sensor protein with MHYT domain